MHVDVNEEPMLKFSWPMEFQMVKVYTKRNFVLFHNELFESSTYVLKCTYENDESMPYIVEMVNGSSSSKK